MNLAEFKRRVYDLPEYPFDWHAPMRSALDYHRELMIANALADIDNAIVSRATTEQLITLADKITDELNKRNLKENT